ncbi:MAG: hypothetical protein IK052_00420 [Bacteroidales bacterium]|nr:hypothetical protein [Bacteroidales bacterium]
MQNTKKNSAKKTFTVKLSKEIGKLWIIKTIDPFRKNFERFYEEDLFHDISKLTAIGGTNYVLDILAGEEKLMDIELIMADNRLNLPGYVEFERADIGFHAARYLVNGCPGRPQLEAWVNAHSRQIFMEYPAFAYIRRK